MRKTMIIVLAVLMVLFFPSCKSEEDKAKDMYITAIDELGDLLLEKNMDEDDKAEITAMIKGFKDCFNEETELGEIKSTGEEALGNLFFGALFYLTENQLTEYITDITKKYPELEGFFS